MFGNDGSPIGGNMIMYIRYWTCSPPPNGHSGGPSRIAVNCLQQVTCTAYENAILAVLEHHVEEQTLPLGDSLLLLRDCWGYAPVYSLIRKSRNACESWRVYSVFLSFFSFCPFVRGYHMHATDLFMLFGVPMLTLVRLDRFHELICLLSPVLTTRNSQPVK